MSDATHEKWKQIAVEIGHRVQGAVNTAATFGTRDETGYILMFFNAQTHSDKSTLVSSCTDKEELKRLLEAAISGLDDGSKVTVSGPSTQH